MTLTQLNILNYRNIREAGLEFSPKLNCFVGLNGQGKTNILDAIYLLSFTKSAYTTQDSQNITHGEEMAMVQGNYSYNAGDPAAEDGQISVSCGLRKGVKKQIRKNKKDYKRLIEHIGLIPLVMVSPADHRLIDEGSDERRRFMDSVISQLDRQYLEALTAYTSLLKQRNALLKKYEDATIVAWDLFEVIEEQMIPYAEYIFASRERFVNQLIPYFEEVYNRLSGGAEEVSLKYISQLQDRDLRDAYQRTRSRDIILGWTSQGVHKDELEMNLGEYPLKRVASQGQQKTFLLAMKLAQALYLSAQAAEGNQPRKPILLLDDIFDKLDSERVARIVSLVQSDDFGQIFITDTDRQHLTEIVNPDEGAKIFYVTKGEINE